MAGQVTYFEVMGHDADKLQAFYGELFGWRFEAVPGMTYGMTAGNGIPGGVGSGFGGGTAGWTTVYVGVDDVKETVERAVRQGGRILIAPMTLPDGMDIAVVTDPEGHAIGLSHAPAK